MDSGLFRLSWRDGRDLALATPSCEAKTAVGLGVHDGVQLLPFEIYLYNVTGTDTTGFHYNLVFKNCDVQLPEVKQKSKSLFNVFSMGPEFTSTLLNIGRVLARVG